jgi:peroxiredoxin
VEASKQQKSRGRWKLFAILLVCASPVIASYLMYYVVKPDGRTNYGEILDPRQHPVPALTSTDLDGKPKPLADFKGKWIMLNIDDGACDAVCNRQLYEMRQLRTAQGKERERVERVWLITDGAPVPEQVKQDYHGTHMLRVDPAAVKAWLPVEQGATVMDHVYIIDPLGNLMMRWPKDADPNRMKKDLGKLLKASRIG